jgi:hypothetical protein
MLPVSSDVANMFSMSAHHHNVHATMPCPSLFWLLSDTLLPRICALVPPHRPLVTLTQSRSPVSLLSCLSRHQMTHLGRTLRRRALTSPTCPSKGAHCVSTRDGSLQVKTCIGHWSSRAADTGGLLAETGRGACSDVCSSQLMQWEAADRGAQAAGTADGLSLH